METPNVTTIQKLVGAGLGVVSSILTALATFAVITPEQMAAIVGAYSALGSFFVIADAIIRNGRARALANPESLKELERPGAPVIR